jgi:hypothetical protein
VGSLHIFLNYKLLRRDDATEEEKQDQGKNFYTFLNVAPNCSDEEIKAAYRRLALIWHPDRHISDDARSHATAKFSRLTHIYEILSNPTKRKLYDLYGEKGLSSGLEVGTALRTYEQLREEFERQARRRDERMLQARLGLNGVLQAALSAEKLLRPWLSADSQHIVQVCLAVAWLDEYPRGCMSAHDRMIARMRE